MGRHHARILSELDQIDLVGVCDTDRPTADMIAGMYGTDAYYKPKDLIGEGLDAVHVVVPTFIHHEIASMAIKSGSHVLIEKPIADTVGHAQEIFALAAEHDVTLMVGHIERFNPAIQKLKELIDIGRLGELISVSTLRVAPYPKRIVDTGIVVDLGSHDIDIMSYLAGSRIREVFCNASSTVHHLEDTASISLTFQNDAIGHIETSWLSKIKARKLFATFTAGFVLVDFIDQSLIVYDDDKAHEIVVERAEPLRKEIEEFLDCIGNGKEPHIGGEASIHAIGVALAALESADKRLPVRIYGQGAMDFTPELVLNGSDSGKSMN